MVDPFSSMFIFTLFSSTSLGPACMLGLSSPRSLSVPVSVSLSLSSLKKARRGDSISKRRFTPLCWKSGEIRSSLAWEPLVGRVADKNGLGIYLETKGLILPFALAFLNCLTSATPSRVKGDLWQCNLRADLHIYPSLSCFSATSCLAA